MRETRGKRVLQQFMTPKKLRDKKTLIFISI